MIPEVVAKCETCDAMSASTRRRLNLPGTPDLCAKCFAKALLKSPEAQS